MPAPQDNAMFANQRPLALPIAQRGALLNPEFGPFRRAPIGTENRGIAAHVHRIVAPMARGDHPAIKIQDTGELGAIKSNLTTPCNREWRDNPH